MKKKLTSGLSRLSCVVLLAASLSPLQLAAQENDLLPDYVIAQFGERPAIPNGPLQPDVRTALDTVIKDSLGQSSWDSEGLAALQVIAQSDDPRLGWILADMMRFAWRREFYEAIAATAFEAMSTEPETIQLWAEATDHLLAWEVPSYPGYLEDKSAVFVRYLPGLEPIFAEGDIAWEQVSWGGVDIDARPYDTTDTICNCIPAADNPETSSAEDATWLKDDDIVFGVEIHGEARAYPRRIMEVREMVNDTLGGRDLGIPYCTLCGAAQAYFTDRMPYGVERPVLRTSGLLSRSNKVMYDINTHSVFDTFLGVALTGPLAEVGISLDQATVITTDWGTWKKEFPHTTVLKEELALGRDFDFRNGRDANGPIFPVGDVDPRLTVHEDIIGVIAESGTPIAFQRSAAFAALRSGSEVSFENVRLEIVAGGIAAVDEDGTDLGSHQAFWFAWSQFHPETQLWPEPKSK